MYIEQIYTGCLSHGAYYIESNGEAAVIDPLREYEPYLERAEQRHAKIKFVFETHFHADFVSGHVDLAAKTGANIVYGPTTMKTGFDMVVGQDGQIFHVGNVKFKLIHTPGHTMESSCYLLTDENGKEVALFTGDTLFIGDVGRPDLAQKVIAELTQEKVAGYMFESLRNKIMPLSDDLIIYPGHGAGSACGKKMSKETQDTLGHQKRTNYALNPELTKDEFIKSLLSGLMPPPAYFPQNVLMNIQGYDSIEDVRKRGSVALDADQFELAIVQPDIVVLDTRNAQVFAQGFVPGSLNIGIEGSFATWVGTMIPNVKQKILLITENGKHGEAIDRLARVGYDHTIGFLSGGFDSWKNAGKLVKTIRSVTAEVLMDELKDSQNVLIDVRKQSEYQTEHVEGIANIPLDYLATELDQVPQDKTVYVHCAAGYRSMIFISYLNRIGYNNLVDVKGGFSAIKALGSFKTTEYHEQLTEL
jgi:hydroxyacylglutathione hydrolase